MLIQKKSLKISKTANL